MRCSGEVVELAPSGLLMVDGDGRIVLANEAATQMFGYTREEMLGTGRSSRWCRLRRASGTRWTA